MNGAEKSLVVLVSFFFISLFLLVIFSPFTFIGAGERGVLSKFGEVQENTLDEGFHFISPLLSVHKYDIRTQKLEADSGAASKDLQSVSTTIALNYHVKPETVNILFQETQGNYSETLIAPAIQESVKSATALFTAEELITKRSEVKTAIIDSLNSRESMRFFTVEDVSIVNFSFSESFNVAIENKVRAEQDALAAKNKLEQTKYESEQTTVSAQAQAESLRIQAQALANNESLVSLEAVRKWDGVLPSYVMSGSIPFINMK